MVVVGHAVDDDELGVLYSPRELVGECRDITHDDIQVNVRRGQLGLLMDNAGDTRMLDRREGIARCRTHENGFAVEELITANSGSMSRRKTGDDETAYPMFRMHLSGCGKGCFDLSSDAAAQGGVKPFYDDPGTMTKVSDGRGHSLCGACGCHVARARRACDDLDGVVEGDRHGGIARSLPAAHLAHMRTRLHWYR